MEVEVDGSHNDAFNWLEDVTPRKDLDVGLLDLRILGDYQPVPWAGHNEPRQDMPLTRAIVKARYNASMAY
jgi:hypothetical protein